MSEDKKDINEFSFNENIHDKKFEDEMRNSYLLYSLSVIMSRAIPDSRDGLKPVQRRILYSMNELNLSHTASFKKSARIVGEVMGKYHPHGDMAIYLALVRMAQNFSMRYPLVNGQGNFGSIDNDPPAAPRYTEARMHNLAETMLEDIEKDTVDFIDNFDGSLKEPVILPTRIPNLLMNGVSGIAVGMSTNIPPHNLSELIAGIDYLIDHPECKISDLFEFIKGPDLPTGGTIVDGERLNDMYVTGKGKFTMRAKYEIEENKHETSIIVYEIPYNVAKSDIITQIVNYAIRQKDAKKDSGIRDVRDESDRRGMRLVIMLKRNANINKVINNLFKHTSLQTTFPVQMNIISGKQPSRKNLKELLQDFINHRIDVTTRKINFNLKKAKKRAHIVEGLIKASQGIDTVIEIIRTSEPTLILENLQNTIGVSEVQAKAITEMRLINLSKLEINKLESELKKLTDTISYCNDILGNESLLMDLIKEDLELIDKKYGDKRRTDIVFHDSELKSPEELIEDEDIVIILTQWGYIKAIPSSQYKVQGRGGKGSKGLKISDNDNIKEVIYTKRLTNLMFITSAGKAYQIPAYLIDPSEKNTKGKHIANYISMQENEIVRAIVPVPLKGDYDKNVVIFTKNGKVKKTSLKDFKNTRASGIKAINLKEDDNVVDSIIVSNDEEEILVLTKKGMALKFKSSDVRVMGRTATGVNAIKLKNNDSVVNALHVDNDKHILIITENGYGKRVSFDQYRTQNRGGVGLKTLRNTSKIGDIVTCLNVLESDEIIVFTNNAKAIRINVSSINVLKRVTQGVITVRLEKNDSIVGSIVVKEEKEAIEF